jgi:hypothetical protein
LRDPVNSVRLQERAFGLFRTADNDENTFFTAMYPCLGYDMIVGNSAHEEHAGVVDPAVF